MVAAWFEGWSEDGRRFVVRTRHGYDMEDLGGSNLLELIQVHDALSGQMIESYRLERVADEDTQADDPLSKAWAKFRADTRLIVDASSMSSPDGDWKLTAEAIEKPPHRSAFDLSMAEEEITTRWTGFEEDRIQTAGGRSAKGPRVHISAGRRDDTWELLTYRVPFDYDQVNASRGDGEPRVEGRVTAFWSPLGDRILLLLAHDVKNIHEEHGTAANARFYVRALGPQIKLVDGGAGREAVHRAAAVLAANGLPVAQIETAEQPAALSGVYYRTGDNDDARNEALARRAAPLLDPALHVEPLSQRGWTQVVIVLGK
jgi:hypothetical protein